MLPTHLTRLTDLRCSMTGVAGGGAVLSASKSEIGQT